MTFWRHPAVIKCIIRYISKKPYTFTCILISHSSPTSAALFFFHVNPPRKHPQNSRGIRVIFRETRNMEQGIYKHGGWTPSSVYFLLLTTWSYLLEEVLNELKSKVIMYSNHIPVNTSITVMNEVIER